MLFLIEGGNIISLSNKISSHRQVLSRYYSYQDLGMYLNGM